MRATSICAGHSSVARRSVRRSATRARTTSRSSQPPGTSVAEAASMRSVRMPSASRRKIDTSLIFPAAIALAERRTMSSPLRSQ